MVHNADLDTSVLIQIFLGSKQESHGSDNVTAFHSSGKSLRTHRSVSERHTTVLSQLLIMDHGFVSIFRYCKVNIEPQTLVGSLVTIVHAQYLVVFSFQSKFMQF